MTERERTILALRHQETDRLPYYCFCTGAEHRRIARYLGDDHFDTDNDFCLRLFTYEGWGFPVPGKPNFSKDAYGVVWDHSGTGDVGVVDGLVIEDIEDHDYHIPPLDVDRARRELERAKTIHPDKFRVFGLTCTLFERAWSLHGMENTLADMVLSPGKLGDLLDEITDYTLKYVDLALEYEPDAIYFGDDWGQQQGLMMGKKHWDDLIRPCVRRLYDRVKSAGKFVIQHSCGDITVLLDELIDLGLDCYQGMQPEIYDLQEIKNRYGSALSFWGGISTQRVLPFGTPEEVYAETKRVMRFMGKGGGYIAAPTVNLPDGIPPENYLAMLKAFREQES